MFNRGDSKVCPTPAHKGQLECSRLSTLCKGHGHLKSHEHKHSVLLGSNGSHVTLYTRNIYPNFVIVDRTRKEICPQVTSSSLDARSPLFAWGYVKEVVVVISKKRKKLKLQDCTICLRSFNNKNKYITVTWVNSECLVWSQKKCEKKHCLYSRLWIASHQWRLRAFPTEQTCAKREITTCHLRGQDRRDEKKDTPLI